MVKPIVLAVSPKHPYVSAQIHTEPHKPGATVELFQHYLNLAYPNHSTIYQVTESHCLVRDTCDQDSIAAAVACGRANASADLFYLSDKELPLRFDYSLPVDQSENYFVIPRQFALYPNGFDSMFHLFDSYTWLACLLIYMLYLALKLKTPRILKLLLLLRLFFTKITRSGILFRAVQTLKLQPAYEFVDSIADAIRSGQAQMVFNEGSKRWLSATAQGAAKKIVDAYESTANSVIIRKTDAECAEAVAKSAVENANGPEGQMVVALLNKAFVDRLPCEQQTYIHLLKYTTSHFSFVFPKHSNLTRHFNQAIVQLSRPDSDIQTLHRSLIKGYIHIRSCVGTAVFAHRTRGENLRITQMAFVFITLALGLTASLMVLLVESQIHKRRKNKIQKFRASNLTDNIRRRFTYS